MHAAPAWRVDREWDGEPCFVLGGGPSLPVAEIPRLEGRGRVLAIKDTHELAPFCDVLFWADDKWLSRYGNASRLSLSTPAHRVTTQAPSVETGYEIRRLGVERRAALSADPSRLAGADSGGRAINLAVLFGAAPIVLLGFDMRPSGHWHARPNLTPNPGQYPVFLRQIGRMAEAISRLDVPVFNATPGSALDCFPFRPLEEFL